MIMEKVYNSSNLRGKANFSWLNTNYFFHFANFFGLNRIQFGLLRVENREFNTSKNTDLNILKHWIFSGNLKHKSNGVYTFCKM